MKRLINNIKELLGAFLAILGMLFFLIIMSPFLLIGALCKQS